jgi:hypothetical protein
MGLVKIPARTLAVQEQESSNRAGHAMRDITNPRVLYFKGGLLLLTGLLASVLLLLEAPTVKVAALLAVAIWCFARAYYFAFYVVEHYVDPGYRFAGLWSFAQYVWARRRLQGKSADQGGAGNARQDKGHAEGVAAPDRPRE